MLSREEFLALETRVEDLEIKEDLNNNCKVRLMALRKSIQDEDISDPRILNNLEGIICDWED